MNPPWLILGSGPTAADDYARVRPTLPDGSIIATCNAGIRIEPDPDIYWLTDSQAVKLYETDLLASHRRGIYIVTSVTACKHCPILKPLASEVLDYSTAKVRVWTPGRLCNCRTSGGLLAQLAVIRGADEVHLIGMSGYATTIGKRTLDYFDGRAGKPGHEDVMRYYGPMMQSMFSQCPGVRFVFHGKVNWPWTGKNVEVLDSATPAALHQS